MPAVAYFGARFGDKWYVDLVALPHNAIRCQLRAAFIIANALGKLALDVGEADLARVYAWLGTLDRFVAALLTAEDRFVYPLVDANLRKAKTPEGAQLHLPELLSLRGRDVAKTRIRELLADARKTRDVATGATRAKINALRFALDQLGANLLDYFAAMEKFVPKLLKKALRNGPKEKDKVEKKMFEYLYAQPHGAMLGALLLQCIESRSRRAEFVNRNIRKKNDRASFKLHVKKVEASHMRLALAFDDVANKYERRFNMSTFVKHYDANTDGYAQETLAMFGDMDINAEGEGGADAQRGGDQYSDDGEQGAGMDDDVIEVLAEVTPEEVVAGEDARTLEEALAAEEARVIGDAHISDTRIGDEAASASPEHAVGEGQAVDAADYT
ncbi:unnamed protein product [Chondrus crispus]|uniref:Uncharacterized protein n=1 Tax=Chondrus crispus TaxID=2769 RepID=R7QIK0_CHOCR|nr:unnamed protein product [Chondrus crispus]CDF37306.1 unnamed protein product [Chondrus crispus]|eukprot:XP_005717125.1 unnamed protein product [Chondrus crispus]